MFLLSRVFFCTVCLKEGQFPVHSFFYSFWFLFYCFKSKFYRLCSPRYKTARRAAAGAVKAQCKATFRCPNPILVIVLVIVRIVIVLVFVLVIVRIMMIAQQTGRGTLGGWKNRAITGTRVTNVSCRIIFCVSVGKDKTQSLCNASEVHQVSV